MGGFYLSSVRNGNWLKRHWQTSEAGIAAGAIPWTPAHGSAGFWMNPRDASTITTSSGVIAQILDISGNDRHAANADTGKRPVLDPTGINGFPAISFLGTEKYLQIPRGFVTNAFTVVVVNFGGAPGSRLLDQRGVGAFGTVKGWVIKNYQTGVSDIAGADAGGGNYRGVSASGMNSDAKITTVVFPASGNTVAYLNGVAIGVPANGGTVPADIDNTSLNIRIGGNAGGGTTQDFVGQIGDAIIFPFVATTDVRQRAEGFAAHAYGLGALLDISHPYRVSPPYV